MIVLEGGLAGAPRRIVGQSLFGKFVDRCKFAGRCFGIVDSSALFLMFS
jgi:hypothetical protein